VAPKRSYVLWDYTCDLSAAPVPDPLERVADGAEDGSFLVAGDGWRQGVATSGVFHRVSFELYKASPPLELDGWGDVLEAPYGSGTGWIGPRTLFGEEDGTHRGRAPQRHRRASVEPRVARGADAVRAQAIRPVSRRGSSRR
jgi:hypothetical protein